MLEKLGRGRRRGRRRVGGRLCLAPVRSLLLLRRRSLAGIAPPYCGLLFFSPLFFCLVLLCFSGFRRLPLSCLGGRRSGFIGLGLCGARCRLGIVFSPCLVGVHWLKASLLVLWKRHVLDGYVW